MSDIDPSSFATHTTNVRGFAQAYVHENPGGTGQFLGWFHLRPRRSDGLIDLGYRLRRSAWGNGYATEGSRALIDKGFSEHDIDRVVAETMTVNLASRRVLEKCGLTYVRTYFDEELPAIDGSDQGYVEYQLTRSEWEPASGRSGAGG